jgi:anhydro-N-acetylmuramic acid kinase
MPGGKQMKVIGMISGTSFDGIDVGCFEIDVKDGVMTSSLVGFHSYEYQPHIHDLIAAAMPPQKTDLEAVCILDTFIGQEFARAAVDLSAKLGITADLIVSHGQTVFHWIDAEHKARGTLQIGEPTWIAEATGVSVLSNIRSRDVVVGGHGAPLVSILDQLLLGAHDEPVAALNLGGISNVTVTGEGLTPIAYDIGPANGLLDAAISAYTNGEKQYDEDGKIAAAGVINQEILARFLAEPYYKLAAPKSTGKELFHLPYITNIFGDVTSWNIEEVMATLLALTVATVAQDVEKYKVSQLFVAGGGSANPVMMKALADRLAPCEVLTMSSLGVDPRQKEALAFAIMGYLSLHGQPGSIPSCTGASKPTILGSFTPGTGPLSLPTPLSKAPQKLVIV